MISAKAPQLARRICFVGQHNQYRSVLAQHAFIAFLQQAHPQLGARIWVDASGLRPMLMGRVDRRVLEIMQRWQIKSLSAERRAQAFTAMDFDFFDDVFALDEKIYAQLEHMQGRRLSCRLHRYPYAEALEQAYLLERDDMDPIHELLMEEMALLQEEQESA